MLQSLLGLVAITGLALADPFVLNLHQLQVGTSGFRDLKSETPDLEATASALFLTSLYGVRSQVNLDDVLAFVRSLQNPNDFGYPLSSGLSSDLEATRFALLSYVHLNQEIPNKEQVGEFVRKFAKVEEGLFAPRVGEVGDIRSTAVAVEALEILGELSKPVVSTMLEQIKGVLTQKVVNDQDTSRFASSVDSATPISDNYFGIYLAKKSGFEFSNVAQWVAYIQSAQDVDQHSPTYGGFRVSPQGQVSAEATAHAVQSLRLLGAAIPQEMALFQFVKSRKNSLVDTAFAHLAFGSTSIFKHTLSVKLGYKSTSEHPVTDLIVEGSSVAPVAVVTAFEKVAHGGLTATVAESKGDWESDLVFNAQSGEYEADNAFDSTDKLGAVEFVYSFKANVYPIGEISLSHSDSKAVGYAIQLDETITFEGAELSNPTTVRPGTEFGFSVTLSTQSKQQFFGGNFEISFKVVDSSGVVQYTNTVDGRSNPDSIDFLYSLSGQDVPAGDLSFLFEVSNGQVVHSTKKRTFSVLQDMVVSNVVVSSTSLKLGDSLRVTAEPGTRNLAGAVTPLSASNAAKRRVTLNLVSSTSVVVLAIQSASVEPTANGYANVFETEIPANLDFVGTLSLSFVYGEDQSVASESGEAYTVSVDASLRLDKLTDAPAPGQTFVYGNAIAPSFKILDTVSGLHVSQGKSSSVSLVVTIGEGKSAFETIRAPAEASASNDFTPIVAIDVNSLEGKGKLSIVGKGSSSQTLAIHAESGDGLAEFPLTIGGEIKVDKTYYTTRSADSDNTAVVVTFSLSSGQSQLTGAKLVATLSGPSKKWHNIPVASDDPSNRYSFGFSAPHADLKSGNYKIEFLRQTDIKRARDAKLSEAGADVPDSELVVKPLFEVSFSHDEVHKGGSWMQMELFNTIIVTSMFLGILTHVKALGKKLA